MKRVQPCGSWDSPIGSADLVRGALRLSAPRLEDGHLFWLEGRPSEGGRQVVMIGMLSDAGGLAHVREASPAGFNVRTRVHEYGGGEYAVWRDRLFFVDDSDGRTHVGRIAGASAPITPTGSCYADLVPRRRAVGYSRSRSGHGLMKSPKIGWSRSNWRRAASPRRSKPWVSHA